ncbi:MAG TPA: glutamine--fructose-6-phosphate transaminase (isomerizing) [Candidatus Saccharibacteria bacterium]|nr:glutamine--fructose-6-phosphate transaminase (isomerizing) [Candidatus Saccharibacteria bacterium]
MCGIVGYVGSKNAQSILLEGLHRLEYRGYDSAGIVTFQDGDACLLRVKGKVAGLDSLVNDSHRDDSIGIGHTRWATHGEPSERNAHPHNVGDIFLVHNGIIENYKDLKSVLETRGYSFVSETDTEVLTALVDSIYQQDKNLFAAVSEALHMVVGAYGIAVVAKDNMDEVVVARSGSPLVIGVGEGETFIASDPSALVGNTNQVIFLKDGEVAKCTRDGVTVKDSADQAVEPIVETIEMDIQAMQKKGFDHFLVKEIFDQPESLSATLAGRVVKDQDLLRLGGLNMSEEELRAVKHIFIVACGTASYASMMASYYIERFADDVVIDTVVASELRYRSFNVPENSLAIFVSQSGETADTIACLKEMKQRGVRCLGVVNAVGSTIAREVDGGIYIHAGAEISVASTKGFTSQVVALVLFGLVMAQAKGMSIEDVRPYIDELDALPEEIAAVLDTKNEEVKQLAADYSQYEHAFYIGRDILYPLALEGALKLKETSYIHVEGQPAGELKHGSIALIDDRFFEVAFVMDNELFEKSMSNIIEVQARGGHVIVVTNSSREIEAERVVRIESRLKMFTPLLFNVVSQLFAYYVAVNRGNDVDQPRNLAKSVTVE